jgi:hypothetical protein
MILSKLSETSSTITLGWTPPAGADAYAFYANGQVASVATRSNKDGSPRSSVKFSKTSPGPPFIVAALCGRAGVFSVDVGTYPSSPPPPPGGVFPGSSVYPSEVSP